MMWRCSVQNAREVAKSQNRPSSLMRRRPASSPSGPEKPARTSSSESHQASATPSGGVSNGMPRAEQNSALRGGDLTPDLGHAESRPGLEEARRSDGGEEDVLGGVPPGRGGAVPDDAGGDGGGHRRGPGDHGLDVVGVAEGRRSGGAPAPCRPVRAAGAGRGDARAGARPPARSSQRVGG